MSQVASNKNVVQLDWADENGIVTVTPRNQDRFNLKVSQAITLLQFAGEHHRFQAEFQVLLNKLAKWLRDKQGIQGAHLTVRDGSLLFVVMRDCAEYDESFEDSLTDLDIDIANDIDLSRIRLDVLSLPEASEKAVETFLNPEFVLSYSPAIRNAD